MKTQSVLEKVFEAGHIAVTGECGPPRGALPDKVREKAALLRGYVDAVNITDNQTAMVRMSSFAASLILKQMDMHRSCRWSAATATAWGCRVKSSAPTLTA
jgi:methylenetetrahydrofolate reductase (NADPH)